MCLTIMGEGLLQTYVAGKPINKNENQVYFPSAHQAGYEASQSLKAPVWLPEMLSGEKLTYMGQCLRPVYEKQSGTRVDTYLFHHEHPIKQRALLIKL